MSAFRTDIQALRAIAVLLVLAFHVWPATIRGGYVGVDVFFVISGYLITGHLVREVVSTGRVDLPAFYARRARRLLPAASLTLVAVGVATYLWMPVFTWETTAADMAASALYAENWALLRRSVDYLAQGQAPSPLQHFWSLAVEEQFYLGWPLLVAGVATAWKRRASAKPTALPGLAPPPPPPRRRAYALPMGALCALSFMASLHYARASATAGYFTTLTRLHELGLGGLLAVWAARTPAAAGSHAAGAKLASPVAAAHPASHWPRTLCAATGLAAIGASGCLFTARLPFPGTAALVPVLGAVAVIAAGEGGRGGRASREGDGIMPTTHALTPALAHPWLQYLGDISYSLYLAHWPVVVMYPFMTGRPVDGALADGVTVLAVSWGLAHACKLRWEDRFRCGGGASASQSRAGELTTALAMTVGMTLAVVAVSAGLHRQASHLNAPFNILPQPADAPPHVNASLSVTHSRSAASAAFGGHLDDVCTVMGSQKGAASASTYPGADVAVHGCPIVNSVPLSEAQPPVGKASDDIEQDYFRKPSCITGMNDATLTPCEAGSPPFNASTPTSRRPHVVLIGNSHAGHWTPAFETVARRAGFRFTCLTKPGCPPSAGLAMFGSGPRKGTPNLPCREWVGKAVDWVLRERPSAVVFSTSGYQSAPPKNATGATDLADGLVRIARQMVGADIPVLGIKATPTLKQNAPQCLAMAAARDPGGRDVSACSTPQAVALSHVDNPVDAAARLYPVMRLLSFDDIFCHNQTCPPMIGNVIVYRDTNHLTATFSATLATVLHERLQVVAPHVFKARWP